jgi:hypothetical protein
VGLGGQLAADLPGLAGFVGAGGGSDGHHQHGQGGGEQWNQFAAHGTSLGLERRPEAGQQWRQPCPMVIGAARPIKSRGLLGPAAGTGYPLTAPLLGGQPPLGVPGARLSSRANDAVIRPALALVLVTSGLKLLGIDNQLGLLVLALVLLAVPVWALDATLHPEPAWPVPRWAGA